MPQFPEITADDLICVNKYYLLHVKWKENVQEEDFVAPNEALLLCLSAEPIGPLVCNITYVDYTKMNSEARSRGRLP